MTTVMEIPETDIFKCWAAVRDDDPDLAALTDYDPLVAGLQAAWLEASDRQGRNPRGAWTGHEAEATLEIQRALCRVQLAVAGRILAGAR